MVISLRVGGSGDSGKGGEMMYTQRVIIRTVWGTGKIRAGVPNELFCQISVLKENLAG